MAEHITHDTSDSNASFLFPVGGTAAKEVQPCFYGNIRLLQQSPAWGLNLALRASGILHTVENVPFSIALGQKLPLLIQGNIISTEVPSLVACESSFQDIIIDDDAILTNFIAHVRDIFEIALQREDPGQRWRCRPVRVVGNKMLEWYYNGFTDHRFEPFVLFPYLFC